MNEMLKHSSKQYELIADQLDEASKHFRMASKHCENDQIPRAVAHAFAGWGHINHADSLLKSESIKHAEHSKIN